MKNQNKNLDKNISRLVKLTGANDTPSKQFIDSLTAQALDQLQKNSLPRRSFYHR